MYKFIGSFLIDDARRVCYIFLPSDNVREWIIIVRHPILIQFHARHCRYNANKKTRCSSVRSFSLPINHFYSPSSYLPCTNEFLRFFNTLSWHFFTYWQLMNIFLSIYHIFHLPVTHPEIFNFLLSLPLSRSLSLATPSQLALYIICSTKECVY